MTGRELCDLIGVDYEQLCEFRAKDQRDNLLYFLKQLLDIPEIRYEVLNLLGLADANKGG
jgi:hypothetical protein